MASAHVTRELLRWGREESGLTVVVHMLDPGDLEAKATRDWQAILGDTFKRLPSRAEVDQVRVGLLSSRPASAWLMHPAPPLG